MVLITIMLQVKIFPFVNLAKENDFKIYANTESTTKHHGSYAWEGKFKESLNG